VIRSTIGVTAISLLGVVLSFGAQFTIGVTFGASAQTDVFFVAATVPMLATTIFTSLVVTGLVPAIIDSRFRQSEDASWKLASTVLTVGLIVLCAFAVAATAAAPHIVALQAPGFGPQERADAVRLLRLNCPVVVLFGMAQMTMAVHNARDRYVLPAASAWFPPIGMAFAAAFFGRQYGIGSVVIGQAVGAAVQLAWNAHGLVGRRGLRPMFDRSAEGLQTMSRMGGPLLLGTILYQSLPMVERIFASKLPVGRITHLSIAQRLGALVGPLLVTGLSVTLYSRLSIRRSQDDVAGARHTLAVILRVFVLVCAPMVLLSPFYSLPLVRLLFEHGAFTRGDAVSVANVLPFYILGLSLSAFGTLIARGYYGILNDTITLTGCSIIGFIVYVLVARFSLEARGYFALAAAQAAYWTTAVVLAGELLRRKLGGSLRPMLRACAQAFLGSIVVAIPAALATTRLAPLAALLVVAICFAAYIGILWLVFQSEEISMLARRILQRPSAVTIH
jgi:putative peptidoglycan lipid II flippase